METALGVVTMVEQSLFSLIRSQTQYTEYNLKPHSAIMHNNSKPHTVLSVQLEATQYKVCNDQKPHTVLGVQ